MSGGEKDYDLPWCSMSLYKCPYQESVGNHEEEVRRGQNTERLNKP